VQFMQSFESVLQAIKKPFLFLSKSSFRRVESVKDLRLRTISLANDGLAATNDPVKTYGLKKIIEIFENYERLSLEDKTGIIKKTLEIIKDMESGRDFIDRTLKYFREEKHKDCTASSCPFYLNDKVYKPKGLVEKIVVRNKETGEVEKTVVKNMPPAPLSERQAVQ